MKKYAIYTAVVGNYDEILQPKVIDDRFDYILFSNDMKETNIGVWQVRPINYTNEVQTKIARWVKTHPEELLPGYEFSIWMDANVRIKTSYTYSKSIDMYSSNIDVATIKHPKRNDIYSECGAVLGYCLEKEDIVFEWLKVIHKAGFPAQSGLNETNVLYRRHCPKVKDMDALWWNCIEQYSKRDQLSFNYVLWKLNIECKMFLPESVSAVNSPDYEYVFHSSNNRTRHVENKSNIVRCNENSPWIAVDYYTIIARSKCPKLLYFFINIYVKVKYIVKRVCPKALLNVIHNKRG